MQRIPPTEKRGRVHTSTVTVSVIDPDLVKIDNCYNKISDNFFEVEWFSGTGKGGQRRNKVKSSCRLTHIPTGITESFQSRSRQNSYTSAKSKILERLQFIAENEAGQLATSIKRSQTNLENYRRTYKFQHSLVIDHNTNKTAPIKKVMRGQFNLLW